MQAVLAAYRDGGGELPALKPRHFGHWLALQTTWLWASAMRALGAEVPPVDAADTFEEDLRMKLDSMPGFIDNIPTWVADLG